MALALAITTGSADANQVKFSWSGGSFENTTGEPANDFHVVINVFRLGPQGFEPTGFASMGPFDQTAATMERLGDYEARYQLFVSYSSSDAATVVPPDGIITLGSFEFLWESNAIEGVEAYWTFDGLRVGEMIRRAGSVDRVPEPPPPPPYPSPEPAGLALLGVGLAGLALVRRVRRTST